MSEQKPRPKPPASHYCDWDAPGRRVVRAICTTIIKRTQHSNDPTCSTCQVILTERRAHEAQR